MFAKIIELKASREEFIFAHGMKEARFRPVIYLSSDRRVLAIGEPPAEGVVAQEAHVFTDRKLENAFALLETLLRYGLREVIGGGFYFGTLTFRISLAADLREELAGFAPAIFHYAATNAGAKKVVIV
jgi:hypothetical protein